MAKPTNHYAEAVHPLTASLREIDKQKDLGLWTACNGALQLAKALKQDLTDLKKKVADIESTVNSPR
jgi:hypothetical protein